MRHHTIIEAMAACRENAGRVDARVFRLHLAVGFTEMPLKAFVTACAADARPDRRIECSTGIYGSLADAVGATPPETDVAVVVIEWPDIDPRLGLRRMGTTTNEALVDVVQTAGSRLDRLLSLIAAVARTCPVTVLLPTLPLVPFFPTPGRVASQAALGLRRVIAEFAEQCALLDKVTVADDRALDRASPSPERRAPMAELGADVPYTTAHMAAVADLVIQCALPQPPLKGLITDLDDTLWRGLIGEVGAEAVAWDLDHDARVHGLYQTILKGLAERGALLGIASKNEPATVAAGLARSDILVPPGAFYPIEVSWQPKSEAVARILEAWNLGAADVLFVDDNPIELAEVKNQFADIRTARFTPHDPAKTLDLITEIRDLFGRETALADDLLRRDSIRNAAAVREGLATASQADQTAFLASLDIALTFDISRAFDAERPLALVNKTNQFNLNGVRFEPQEWRRFGNDPATFLLTVDYVDKFGPLGSIAAVRGTIKNGHLTLDTWVLSCRAFSRRIEHAILDLLVRAFETTSIACAYTQTDKNKVLTAFLEEIGLLVGGRPLRVATDALTARLLSSRHKETVRDVFH